MDYLTWRATFQDAEKAAQAAFKMAADSSSRANRYKHNLKEARSIIDDINEELEREFEPECWQEYHEEHSIELALVRSLINKLEGMRELNVQLQNQKAAIKDQAVKQAAELLEREVEVRQLRRQMEPPRSDLSPLNRDFGLSRASWLVAPRVILEAMPLWWQTQLSALTGALNERFDWNPDGLEFHIQAKKHGRFIRIPDHLNNYRHPDWHWLESIDRTKQKEPADG